MRDSGMSCVLCDIQAKSGMVTMSLCEELRHIADPHYTIHKTTTVMTYCIQLNKYKRSSTVISVTCKHLYRHIFTYTYYR